MRYPHSLFLSSSLFLNKFRPNTDEHFFHLKIVNVASQQSPILEAVKSQEIEQVRAILAKGIDLNAPENAPAFFEAVKLPDLAIATLLAESGANLNYKDSADRTALHQLLRMHPFSEAKDLIRLLIAKGANLNLEDATNFTPLHIQALSLLLAEDYFSKANQTLEMAKKQAYLKQSLHYTLAQTAKNQPLTDKKAAIVKIALCAIAQENETVEEKELPDFLMRLMREELSAETWFHHFEQIKEDRKRSKEQTQVQNALLAELSAMRSELASLRQVTDSLCLKVESKTFLTKQEPKVPAITQALESIHQEENKTKPTR